MERHKVMLGRVVACKEHQHLQAPCQEQGLTETNPRETAELLLLAHGRLFPPLNHSSSLLQTHGSSHSVAQTLNHHNLPSLSSNATHNHNHSRSTLSSNAA